VQPGQPGQPGGPGGSPAVFYSTNFFTDRLIQYIDANRRDGRPFFAYAAYTSPDETAFVRWSLARALRAAGFAAVQITPHDWLHPATPVGLIDGVARLGGIAETVPVVRECAGSLLIAARRP